MPEPNWKRLERKVAAILKGKRNPLSGRASGHGTSADVLMTDDNTYIEVKYRARFSILTLMHEVEKQATKEGKTPVLILGERGKHNLYMVIRVVKDDEVHAAGTGGDRELETDTRGQTH